ncbi:hypothetical protein AB0M28_05225 [Streptomyces sp. NPDC051940]|uniref:hypothetical protein n=1 Tax=Streptomyces sp. NPDC051940 TaxID=3155675 RepID=UPI00341B7E45
MLALRQLLPSGYRQFLTTRGRLSHFMPAADDRLMPASVNELIRLNEVGDVRELFGSDPAGADPVGLP